MTNESKKRRGIRRLAFWRRRKERKDQKQQEETQPPKVVVMTHKDSAALTLEEDETTAEKSNSGITNLSSLCPICFEQKSGEEMSGAAECVEHRACYDCLSRYMSQEISEGRISVSCPECPVKFHPHDIRRVLERSHDRLTVEQLMAKYEDFTLRRVLVQETDLRYCPAPDCSYGVIASNCAGCPRLVCQRDGCGTSFCYHCKQRWHPNMTCDESRRLHSQNAANSPSELSELVTRTEALSSPEEIKPCPRCKTLVSKVQDGTCNHMTCFVCGVDFCWLCMREITDLHYLRYEYEPIGMDQ